MFKKTHVIGLAALAALLLVAAPVSAQETTEAADNNAGLIAIGAGLAVGLAGIATGLAQAGIGSAAVGATAEDEKNFGKGLVLTVIPETIVIFGLVIAILLMGNI